MELFERISRVARAEANYRKSQSVDPEEEINRAISLLRDVIVKTRLALIKTPENQREILKRNLINLETKLAETQARKNTLVARLRATRLSTTFPNTINGLNTGSAMSAFERMEEKVLMMEAKSQAAGELAGADLEAQFAMLESGSDVDDELAAMKAQIAANPKPSTTTLTPSEWKEKGFSDGKRNAKFLWGDNFQSDKSDEDLQMIEKHEVPDYIRDCIRDTEFDSYENPNEEAYFEGWIEGALHFRKDIKTCT